MGDKELRRRRTELTGTRRGFFPRTSLDELSTTQETQTQRSEEKKLAGTTCLNVCVQVSKRKGVWVWVSFIVLTN